LEDKEKNGRVMYSPTWILEEWVWDVEGSWWGFSSVEPLGFTVIIIYF
jgi:hypothetical protein